MYLCMNTAGSWPRLRGALSFDPSSTGGAWMASQSGHPMHLAEPHPVVRSATDVAPDGRGERWSSLVKP